MDAVEDDQPTDSLSPVCGHLVSLEVGPGQGRYPLLPAVASVSRREVHLRPEVTGWA